MPEVSLVAILDADKEGFLRDERSLTQTAGRAARNSDGLVIFYADKITKSMQNTMDETDRRRLKQIAHNTEFNITPTTVTKSIEEILGQSAVLEIKITMKANTMHLKRKIIQWLLRNLKRIIKQQKN